MEQTKGVLQEVKQDLIVGEITPDQHIFLGGDETPIQQDGQWVDFLPDEEEQRKKIESSNCTAFAWLNAIEIFLKRVFKITENNSDRFLGIVAGTTPQGNDPHIVGEAIRRFGCIPEKELPFDENISTPEAYYTPKPIPGRLIALGDVWRNRFNFKHQWVLTGTPDKEKLTEGLKFSPIGIGVFAWYYEEDENGERIYKRYNNRPDGHWTLLVGYKENEYWLVFDSYAPFLKKLDWNYDIRFAKKISISDAVIEAQLTLISVLKRVVDLLRQLIKQKYGIWQKTFGEIFGK